MAVSAAIPDQVLGCFSDQAWRLNNLYWITDKEGRKVKFEMNWGQEALLRDLHYLNIILKARQIGFTTFIQLYMLDIAVFYRDTRAGVIAHTKDDAEAIFRDKIKYPYDNLPEQIKGACPILRSNTTTLELANNSLIRVGTSLRGGTLQYLHISEFGKICAKYPEKAREIVTGALNTLQSGQIAFIESTAEGQEGTFYDFCQQAQTKARTGQALTPLDWKFHFFPWWKEGAYAIDATDVVLPADMVTYFAKLFEQGIVLTRDQMAWYAKKAETQGADMKREYPSTPKEAFEASVEGAYYGLQLAVAESQGRVGHFPSHPELPVHTVQDIGVGDLNTIWFFQIAPSTVRVVGYYSNSGEGMPHYVAKIREMAKENSWRLGTHYLPHDGRVREWGTGLTRYEQFLAEMSPVRIVPSHKIDDGINAAREVMRICQFDEGPCSEGLKALRNYRKDWDEEHGCFRDTPRHDWASHGADAYRYLAMVYKELPPVQEVRAPVVKGLNDMTWNELMAAQQPENERI